MATAMYSGGRIRTNLPATQAYNSLVAAGQKISESQLRLSTGKRINSAADDVAGFITAKSLTARNGSLMAAKQAAGDAKNVTSIAMDSLEQISDLLTQIKGMAAQASAGALGTDEKVTLANSAFRLAEQIQFITDSTVFGGKQLLQGAYSGEWVTGYSASNQLMTIAVDLDFYGKKHSGAGTDSYVNMYNISTGDDAVQFHLNSTLNQAIDNPKAEDDIYTDPKNGTTNFAGVAGLNLQALARVTADNLTSTDWGDTIQSTLMSLDKAITNVNKVATYLGGIQTRLSSQEETLTSQITNYKSAISRIEDADVAEEQMKLITNQFLQSASLISLSQANQSPTEFLQLLR